ncbi:MAG: ATP-binding protein [Candidatus Methanoplasma sp.]|jgi:AAA+ ATPase superfamily predicted ATPase|nr:ATP-binding protein [Candidatus Methanoplasma sp.]
MDGFVGRREELRKLNEWYSGGDFEFVGMYGRRRVGKTSIIREFVRGKRTIFFTARKSRTDSNLHQFRNTVFEALGESGTGAEDPDDLMKIIAKHSGERLVLVIDEYPLFVETDDVISSVLQIAIDHMFEDTKLFIILCGSSMNFMKRQVLGYESPLYGRRTREMHVRPMNYRESAEFFPGRSPYEAACIYGAVGGIPMYLRRFTGGGSVERLIAREFFTDASFLAGEPESLILQEMKDPRRYNDIIAAASEGRARIKEICDSTGLASAEVSKCLDDLIDLGYVKRTTPVNGGARTTRYFIDDNLFRFCYGRVFGNSHISAMSEDAAAEQVGIMLSEHMGGVFEDMCGQFVKERMGYHSVGKWWGSPSKEVGEIEVDIAASRRTAAGRTEGLFAECKFRTGKVGPSALTALRDHAQYIPGFDSKSYAIFSRGGFSDELVDRAAAEDVALVSLKDMYET